MVQYKYNKNRKEIMHKFDPVIAKKMNDTKRKI